MSPKMIIVGILVLGSAVGFLVQANKLVATGQRLAEAKAQVAALEQAVEQGLKNNRALRQALDVQTTQVAVYKQSSDVWQQRYEEEISREEIPDVETVVDTLPDRIQTDNTVVALVGLKEVLDETIQ